MSRPMLYKSSQPKHWFPPASRLKVPPLPDPATTLTRASTMALDSAL